MTAFPPRPVPSELIQAAALRPASAAVVQAAVLRAAFPGYAVNVITRRDDQPRFEVVSRDGGSPYCLISTDAREIWRELRNS